MDESLVWITYYKACACKLLHTKEKMSLSGLKEKASLVLLASLAFFILTIKYKVQDLKDMRIHKIKFCGERKLLVSIITTKKAGVLMRQLKTFFTLIRENILLKNHFL